MKQNKIIVSIGFLTSCLLFACTSIFNAAQSKEIKNSINIGFYNVENLFDTIDNPIKNDNEFLPTGVKAYGTERYNKKLIDLDKVIAALNNGRAPDILGLSEIENKTVLNDLIKQGSFLHSDFGIVHQESEDFRGIDCALLYNKTKMQLLSSKFLRPTFPNEKELYTSRDVVYASLKLKNKEVIHILVNHWPSRYGGKEKSEPRRLRVANMVKSEIEKIYIENKDAKILLMGDFNDEPFDKSCKDIIGACSNKKALTENQFFSLFGERAEDESFGTYNYRGNWNVLDQFIVSEDFLNAKSGYKVSVENAKVLKEDWMLYYDKKYEYYKPSKTYGGPNYYGGYSDHLPIYLNLKNVK